MESDLKTLAARLALYEIALKDFSEKSWHSSIRNGFCFYFHTVHSVAVYGTRMQDELPELYEQRPEKLQSFSDDGWYWFPKEYVESRINCLRAAIRLTKTKINNEDKKIKNEKSS